MMTWIIEPHDPLIVRDGRPFGPIPGARATSHEFPFPSTTTGGVRTRYGLNHNKDFGDPAVIKDLKENVSVRGPLLVEIEQNEDRIRNWFAPAPADALLLDLDPPDRERAIVRQLLPLRLPDGAETNLPPGLSLVSLTTDDKGKPCGNAPRYWYWQKFEQWLLSPNAFTGMAVLSELGHKGPMQEARTHVSVQPDTWTAAEGALFQTRGLEFTHQAEPRQLSTARRLALAVSTNVEGIKSGLAPLGGERRLVNWRATTADSAKLPECPPTLRETISRDGRCRLVLLTPACFTVGFYPQQQTLAHAGVTPAVKAVATSRAQVVSGWDFETRKPKLTRRLVPAGAVFFLELAGDEQKRSDWFDEFWMKKCVSDQSQDQRDGFGLAVLGSWSKLEVKQ